MSYVARDAMQKERLHQLTQNTKKAKETEEFHHREQPINGGGIFMNVKTTVFECPKCGTTSDVAQMCTKCRQETGEIIRMQPREEEREINFLRRIDKNVRVITAILIVFATITLISAISLLVLLSKINEIPYMLARAFAGV